MVLNNLTWKYETTVTAPGKSSYPLQGHYYPVIIKAVDDAGNVTTADPLIISAVVVEIIPALLCSDWKYIQTSNNRCIEVTEGAA